MRQAGLRAWTCLFLIGCGPSAGVPDAMDEGTSTGMSTSGVPTTTAGPSDTDASTTRETSASTTFGEEGDDSGESFIIAGDWGGDPCAPGSGALVDCCDVWAQDCPEDTKCAPWSNDGSGVWNAARCTPLDPAPDPVGAPCHVEGHPGSGVDSCELGALCWNVDADTLEGECVSLCQGNPQNPSCEHAGDACAIFNDGVLILCLPTCDPLGDDCDEGLACHPNDATFVCVPEQDREKIAERCEARGGCATGQACATFPELEACAGGCCAPYCNLDDPLAHEACDGLEDGHVCRPWFDDAAPSDYAHVGVCGPA